MARIKQIINERKIAYEQAIALRYENRLRSNAQREKRLLLAKPKPTVPAASAVVDGKGDKVRARGRRRPRRLQAAAIFRANSLAERVRTDSSTNTSTA